MNPTETQPAKQDFFLLDQPHQELINSVEKFFNELILGHTGYQIKNFIIGQFHTPDRKHRQCLQEMHKRYRGVVQYHYEYKKLQIEIEREELKIEQCRQDMQGTDELKTRFLKLAIREAENEIEFRRWNLDILRRSLRETLREMVVFKQELDRLTPLRKHTSYEDAEPEYWETQYVVERLKGKKGDNLPSIPNKPEIEGLIKKQIELGAREIRVDRLLEEKEVTNHA